MGKDLSGGKGFWSDSMEELLVHKVDHLATVCPDAIYAEFPVSHDGKCNESFHQVTYGALSIAINSVAWWLENTFGRGKNFETLAYIGPNDLRYIALTLGAVKAGFVMFLTSPHNNAAAQTNLFTQLKCKTLLTGQSNLSLTAVNLNTLELRVVEVPSVDDLLVRRKAYDFNKTFEHARFEPLVVIHTSGSTGLPKPILWTNDFASSFMKHMSLDPPMGWESQDSLYQRKRVLLTFPPYNGAYTVIHLFNAISCGTVIISPVATAVPLTQAFISALQQTTVDVAFVVPSIVNALARDPEKLELVSRKLQMLIYCGGEIPQALGDIVASRIRLISQYGASEMGLTASLQRDTESEWQYVHFHPDIGVEMRHHSEKMYELVIVRDAKQEEHQPAFKFFPDLEEYPSRDLWTQHPIHPNLWQHCARLDDIITLSNGDKINPNMIEQHISAYCPEVSAVLMVGSDHPQPALLIEMNNGQNTTPMDRVVFAEKLWPLIEEASKRYYPEHAAHVSNTHILFTNPTKSLLRAGKGTLQRQLTTRLYAPELEALYAHAATTATVYS